MTALDLIKFEIDSCGGQLTRALNGVDGSHKDFRLHDGGYSFWEQLAHLGEAYTATIVTASGGEHEWGSYAPKSAEWDDLVKEVLELREEAVAAVLFDEDDKLKLAVDYIIFHDLYHVGQIATMRLQVQQNWEMYEIYA